MAAVPTKFKTGAQVRGKLALPDESASKALTVNSSGQVTSSVTTDAELAFVSGATSNIQTQISANSSAISTAQTNISNLVTLSGVATNATNLGTFTGSTIPDNQTVKSALQSLESAYEALPDPMTYKGLWNASTNSPTLTDGTGHNGDVYQVTTSGTQFSPAISFDPGDKVVYNGATSKYEKWDQTDAVSSVFGRLGAVTAQSGDYTTAQVTEVTNLYFTDERAQDAVGNILTDSSTIDFTYNDAGNTITAAAITQLSLTSDASGLKLVNDAATPGNTKYYGTDAGGTKGFFSIPAVGSAGDIQETSFSAANNQASAANVTGLAFANGVVRSFNAQVSIFVNATTSLYETFKLQGIQKGASWEMSVESAGDEAGIVFTITSAGQVQYTTASYAGFVAATVKFRALTLSV